MLSRAITAGLLLISAALAPGVILLSTGDPTQNTTAPTGLLSGSGWQYEGTFGSFLGTAIDPKHFITVQHIGVASTFFYQGANYTIVQWFDDPQSDLRIFEVAETFPTYAPLYSRGDELGRNVVVFGRGTQRGDALFVGGTLHGWLWGASDGVQRWGESQVSQLQGTYLYCTFDQVTGGPNEAHLSSGDSGGAVFITDNGVWKLAGLHYGVDGPFAITPGDPTFNACLFDMRGLFDSTLGRVISGTAPVPSGFYSIRISERLSWIVSIVPAAAPPPTPTPTPTPVPSPTPSTAAAQMIAPKAGSTLSGASTTFTWSAGSASAYKLYVGTSPGLSNIYTSGKVFVRSATVGNLPTNGSTVYVRLLSLVRYTWQSFDYTYSTFSAASSTPTPTPAPSPTSTPAATPTATPRATPPERGGGGN
jgi:hypothetical protein